MENNKDNQIIIIIVLFFLGFLIYHLTKPSCNEQFTDITMPINNQTSIPLQDNTNQTIIRNHDNIDIKEYIGDSKDNISKDINNINPNDNSIINIGTELDYAFKKPDVPELTPDIVNSNQNNVKQYNVKDFLPKEINNEWFDTDFSQAKYNINDDKLINTERYVIGINTVGQSLKNASWDIRGSIPNPKFSVSPWNNSTIEADYNIKPLC